MSPATPVPPGDAFTAYQQALSRGHQATGRRDLRAALEAYRAAAALAGERALPHVLVGRTLLALKRPEEALRAFDEALDRAAEDGGALAGKAEALLRLGRRDEAGKVRAQLEQAEQARANQLLESAGGGTRAEVLAIAAERAWVDGRAEVAVDQWLAAARAHASDGHVDAALDVCQRALLADPGAGRVHLEMSRHYLAGGLVEHAVERLRLLARLLELEPDDDLRAGLLALVGERSESDPRLTELAKRLDEPSPT